MSSSDLILVLVLAFIGTPILGLLCKWVDRVVTARIQWRKGPPPYQPFADVLKLLGKETLVSENASTWTFLAAPVLGFIGLTVVAAILWANVMAPVPRVVGGAIVPHTGFVGDIIIVVYFLVFPALAIILGGSASGSPHSALGASRETKLVIAYELPFILALTVVVLNAAGGVAVAKSIEANQAVGPHNVVPSFTFVQIALAQQTVGPMLCTVSGLLAFLCALAVMQAKLGVVPFDQAEAETEIMGGAILEYSGPPLALIHLSRAMLLFLMPMFIITLFWGGLHFDTWQIGLGTVGKFVALLVVVILVRNTKARLRIDQAMRFFWFVVTPVALVACVISLYERYFAG